MTLQYTGLPSIGSSSGSGGVQTVTITSTGGTIAVTSGGTSSNPTFNLETTGASGKIFTDGNAANIASLASNSESNTSITWGTPLTTSISVAVCSATSTNNVPLSTNIVSKNLNGAIVQVYNPTGITALNVVVSAIASGV